jgi:formyltetrahydrofolate deformylase
MTANSDVARLLISCPDRPGIVAAEAGIPFHHVPMSAQLKPAAEAEELRLLAEYQVDTIVLARYMQVLSSDFLARYPAAIINIHHSFLPAFVGATAHYVSEELDGGRSSSRTCGASTIAIHPKTCAAWARYIERVVLARSVTWHVEDRVLLHGNKTIVFA